ncbi:MAG: hydrogenase 4 subunit B, partial [Streptomycetaceae bacterium]|nr:hydrogenase 4 subunit B [Streptomycetaceae bacterium]
MSAVGPALVAASGLAGVAATAGAVLPERLRLHAAGWCTAGAGAAGMVAGGAALGGARWSAHLPGLLPLAGGYFA